MFLPGRSLALALAAAALIWVAVLVAVPIAVGRRVAVLAPSVVYAGAGLVCHQRRERSFEIAGAQMPVCARCFGLYAAGAAGAVAALAGGARRKRAGSRGMRTALAIAAAPTVVTVAVEWLGVAFPSNAVRALAAAPLGAAAGWIFVQLLRD